MLQGTTWACACVFTRISSTELALSCAYAQIPPPKKNPLIPPIYTPSQATFAISLQQPEPATYALFDEVVVLAEGREIFHGPRENIVDYFNALGFFLPARKEVVDFLQNLASPKDQAPLRECNPEGDIYGQYIPPRILEREWKDCAMFREMVDYMAVPIKADPVNDRALATEKFALNTVDNVKILFARYMILEHREWIITGYRFIQVCVCVLVGVLVGACGDGCGDGCGELVSRTYTVTYTSTHLNVHLTPPPPSLTYTFTYLHIHSHALPPTSTSPHPHFPSLTVHTHGVAHWCICLG